MSLLNRTALSLKLANQLLLEAVRELDRQFARGSVDNAQRSAAESAHRRSIAAEYVLDDGYGLQQVAR